jgi:hypothetical protein
VGDNPSLAFYPGATIAAYSPDLGHNIPKAMWDFLNLKGTIIEGGRPTDGGTIANWVFVMGYPITEPYWARIKIDGVYYDALFQMYQRRALAYIPSFPAGWQVQMGNVGSHYYRWLYGGPLPAPLVAFTPTPLPTSTPLPTATATYTPPPAVSATAQPTQPAVTGTSGPTRTPTPPPGTLTPTPTFPSVPTEPPGGLIAAVRPPYGSPDTLFTFEATGLQGGENVQVQFTDPTGSIVYPAGSNGGFYAADAQGRLRIELVPLQAFPAAPTGIWLFELAGLSSGQQAVVGFTLR